MKRGHGDGGIDARGENTWRLRRSTDSASQKPCAVQSQRHAKHCASCSMQAIRAHTSNPTRSLWRIGSSVGLR